MNKKTNIRWIGSLILGLLGIAAALLTLQYVLENRNSPPKILQAPESAAECTDALMNHICQGEFDSASRCLYGSPDLELGKTPEDTVARILWEAYLESMDYRFLGECYATESGLARDLHFRCLDISSVMDPLGPIAQEIFHARVESTEDQHLIYNSNNNYRDDFVQEILVAAVEQSLAENAEYRESTVTLQLAYHQGQWLVIPDSVFMDTVFGEITG